MHSEMLWSAEANLNHVWPVSMLAFAAFMQYTAAPWWVVSICASASAFAWVVILATHQALAEKAVANATVVLTAVAVVDENSEEATVLSLIRDEEDY